MIATSMRPRPGGGLTNGHTPPGMRISPTKPRRNGALIAVGVLLMVGCGLIAAVLQMRATSKTAVLAVAHQVPAGQVVRSGDLSTVELSGGAGLSAIAANDRGAVVGKTAAVTLLPGTLLTRKQLATSNAVTEGKVVIGLSLKPAQMPTSRLKEGDEVLVVATGPAAQLAGDGAAAAGGPDRPSGAVLVRRATVFAVDGSGNNDNTSVSILVDEADAPAVAGAASVSQVTLVLQSAS
ncbi:MAG: SAF domain-containing protein [Acidimicrobiia bacterium]|nr:SAF domain-containing protein [Acidimicrobiia bacterium]